MSTPVRKSRAWSDEQLANAVARERSWRGVCRVLGLKGTSAGVLRTAKRHAERLHLDTSHFTHRRTWSDAALRDAVSSATTWSDVLHTLGLTDRGEARLRVKGHAVRLGLDVSHLQAQAIEHFRPDELDGLSASPSCLRVAAEAIAIAWLSIRGVSVAIPTGPQEYDLLATFPSGIRRIQVKSTTSQPAGKWVVGVGRRPYTSDKSAGKVPYDPDSVDYFLVINGDGAISLIPSRVIAGRTAVLLDNYADYRVGDASSLFAAAPDKAALHVGQRENPPIALPNTEPLPGASVS